MGKPKKLEGRKNFDEWKGETKAWLSTKGHWKCFEGVETDADKNFLAIQALNLTLTAPLYAYTDEQTLAKRAWDAICTAFEDSGIGRRVDLLKQLVSLKQNDCESMEDYVHKMVLLSRKVKKAGLEIGDEVVAALMLAGLPDEYRPMVMAIENSSKKLTSDYVQTQLLQEVSFQKPIEAGAAALIAKKRNPHNNARRKSQHQKSKQQPNNSETVTCYVCGKKGHYASKCEHRKGDTDQMMLCSFVAHTNSSSEWFIDSGASAHMTSSQRNMIHVQPPANNEIVVGNNSRLEVQCAGDINIKISDEQTTRNTTLKNVLCIPGICANLLSVSQMAKHGCTVVFDSECCKVFNAKWDLIAKAPLVDDLYRLKCSMDRTPTAMIAVDKQLWHRRMGHSCDTNLEKVKSAVTGIEYTNGSSEACVTCVQGKQTRASFNESQNRASGVLDLVHSDVAFMPSNSFGGAKYFVTFVDDYSRKVFVYPMKQKNEVYDLFVQFKSFVEKQTGRSIKVLRTDNGTEYCNKSFDSLSKKSGILHQRTVPHTPEQNGVAERMNRTIMDKVRCMLIDSKLDNKFWAEATSTAVYLINRIPCRGMKHVTPEERWSGAKPDLSSLRVFGCRAMAHIPKAQRTKLDVKSIQCIFVGYSEQSKAYRLYNPKTRNVLVSRDVVFIESDENKVIEIPDKTNRSALSSKNNKIDETVSSDDDSSDNSSDYDSSDTESDDSDSDTEFSEAVASFSEANRNQSPASANIAKHSTPTSSNPRNNNNNESESQLDASLIIIDDTIIEADRASETIGEQNESNYVDVNEANNDSSEAMTSVNSSNASLIETEFDVAASELEIVPRPFSVEKGIGNLCESNARKAIGLYAMLAAATEDVQEPKSYREAIQCDEARRWEEAMACEYHSLIENDTWEMCDLPNGRKAIANKWVFKVKRSATGVIERYKARLVVKGYSQVRGIDYDETYSPVARYSSIRFLLAMAAKYQLIIHQMDAVTAFLQGELAEEIYMTQPEGFDDNSKRVCRLMRPLYGLKQSSRAWNSKLNDVLTERLKFNRSSVDQCIYFKHSQQNTIVLAVWVDDLMIFSSNGTMCTKLKNDLQAHFKMKDLGEVKSLLGMNITRNVNGSISIDQRHYIETVLRRFKMENCNPVASPMEGGDQRVSDEMCPRNAAEQQEMDAIPYQAAIGSLMYAAQISRPDICYAVCTLSRYNNNYGREHWTAAKRVLRYLKGTIDVKLTFQPNGSGEMVGFCDADHAGDRDRRRSTSGYVFTIQGGAISWASKRQRTTALSTTEAEFMSMVSAVQEALWLKRFECEMFLNASKTITLYGDNQGALALAKHKGYHARTKHIDVRKYFIEDHLLREGGNDDDIKIKLEYISTNQMTADILTKPMSSAMINRFAPEFGLGK